MDQSKLKKLKPKILTADDEENITEAIAAFLNEDYNVIIANNGKQALELAIKEKPDLVLLDVMMPRLTGLEALKEIKKVNPDTVVIMLTAMSDVGTVVEAMRLGAANYLTKPFDSKELLYKVKDIMDNQILPKKRKMLPVKGRKEILTQDSSMLDILDVVETVAANNATVLIQGESGTGKELMGRAIHNRGPRAGNPFVVVNCAAIPENLIESELFGHEKGSFTGAIDRHIGKFEQAHGGTIFMDEIDSLPLPLQAKLLRVIQEKEIDRVGGSEIIPIDVRIIAVTNTDLKQRVEEKKFREDLFYRLNVVPMTIPPIRERKDDILLLAQNFIDRFSVESSKKVTGLSDEVRAIFMRYGWPGNVRELENLMERLVVLHKGDGKIKASELPKEIFEYKPKGIIATADGPLAKEEVDDLENVEKRKIKEILAKTEGNISKAATLLGIHRNTLTKKIKDFRLEL